MKLDHKVYLRAAEWLDEASRKDRVSYGCCTAIVKFGPYELCYLGAQDFEEYFRSDEFVVRSQYWLTDFELDRDEQLNRRVLALLFMAEMVRLGDA